MKEITVQDDQRDTPLDTSTMITNETNPNSEKTHPHPYTKGKEVNPHVIHTNTGTIKQKYPIQSTCGQLRGDAITNTLREQGNKKNPSPEVHRDSQNPRGDTTSPAWELAQTRDPQGVDNFHQDSNGKLTTTGSGYPQCNYCKLPNHSRQRCTFRLKDLENNIDRQVHPRKE